METDAELGSRVDFLEPSRSEREEGGAGSGLPVGPAPPPAAPCRPLPARHRGRWERINNLFITALGRLAPAPGSS